MPLDLNKTIKDARKIYYEVMDEIGVDCLINGTVSTKVLYKDFENPENELKTHCKTTNLKVTVSIKQGDAIQFSKLNEATNVVVYHYGLCFSEPTQDPVSSTANVLIFNSQIDRKRIKNVYNIDRTIKSVDELSLPNVKVYIERINYNENFQDIGLQNDLKFKLVCNITNDIKENDIIIYNSKEYIVTNIEDKTKTNITTCYLSTKKG